MSFTYKPEIGSLSEVPNGSWQSLSDQIPTAANAEHIVAFDSTDFERSIRLVSTNRLYVDNSGLYNIQYAMQLFNTGGGGSSAHAHFWFKVNGTAVPETASRQSCTSNSPYQAASRDYFLTLVAGDYVQVAYEVSDTSISLLHEAASGVIPVLPSAVLTMTMVG